MRTIVGVSIIVAVAAVLAGLLWWFAVTREPAANTVQEDGLYKTINLQDSCSSEWDSCCESSCNDFCDENGQDYFNHHTNNYLCSCWCSA
ncbi:hypothetical protein D6764_03395 [Candidatus Woesearchaeota archaeon]|nr:MAG: hypothetical protein D6764_03395 [Candidatus Woesearchaeota archaeon]